MNKPKTPAKPLIRITIDSNPLQHSSNCEKCNSSMEPRYFWRKPRGCVQPECSNYYNSNIKPHKGS